MKKGTGDLLNQLINVKDDSQLDSYIESIQDDYPESFVEYMTKIMEKKGVNKSTLHRIARLDKTYVYQIFNGTRKNPGKDKIVMMAIALRMSIDETQRALNVAGQPTLYAKNTRDSILMYALNLRLDIPEVNLLLEERGEKPLE